MEPGVSHVMTNTLQLNHIHYLIRCVSDPGRGPNEDDNDDKISWMINPFGNFKL